MTESVIALALSTVAALLISGAAILWAAWADRRRE